MDNIPNEEQTSAPVTAGGLDLMDCLYAVKKRLWLVALTTVLGIGCSIVYLARTTPVFATRSVLLIEQRAAQVVRMDSVEQTDARYLDVMNTLVETMRSRTFLQRVVDNLNLQENPNFLPKNENGIPHTKEEAVGVLAGCIKTSLRKNTRLVDIGAEHANPEIARLLADSVAKEFILFGNDQRMASAQAANEYINDELSKLQDKLHRTEKALQQFPQVMHTGPTEQNQDITVDQLKDLNARFSAARAERLSLETERARAIENAHNPEELLKLPSVAGHPIVAPLLAALVDKESNLVVLRQQYKSKHPKYITAVAEIESLKASLYQKAMEASERISISCSIAKDQEDKLSKSVAALEQVLAQRNRDMVDYNTMKREYDSDRAMYESMRGRMKEIDVTKGVDGSPIKIVDSATVPGVPIRPQKFMSVVEGGLFGLALGVAGTIGIHQFRRRLRTVGQVEKLTGLPVLGALMKRTKASTENPKEFVLHPQGNDIESFRALQTAISARKKSEDRRVLMITSAIPGEGKTYVSINLAMASAQSCAKTLLIDADMRKKTCSRILSNVANTVGFSDVLAGNARLENVVASTEVPNLFFMAAGENLRSPAEWLSPAALKSTLGKALEEFDQIILDTPPVLAVSDSLIMAAEIQAVCYVVGAGKVQFREVERACKLLAETGNQPLGVALNFMEKQWGNEDYYYGDYYAKAEYEAVSSD
ncbi:MAG: polysaccharide biosynthesis tyrosine autokinase [Verrucomicrobia bacterium]|nr:polysaccharide biosynthesis tyrosine autokinase [Verrucomicrobiota bacterium]